MALGSGGIATWANISPLTGMDVPSSLRTSSQCPTKSSILSAVNSSYSLNLNSYDSNQCVKYTDMNLSLNTVATDLTIEWWNYYLNTGDANFLISNPQNATRIMPIQTSDRYGSDYITNYCGVTNVGWYDCRSGESAGSLISVGNSSSSVLKPLKVSSDVINSIGNDYGNGVYYFYYPFKYSSNGVFSTTVSELNIIVFYFTINIHYHSTYRKYVATCDEMDAYVSLPNGLGGVYTYFDNQITYDSWDAEIWYNPFSTYDADNYVGILYDVDGNGSEETFVDYLLPNVGYMSEWDGLYFNIRHPNGALVHEDPYGGSMVNLLAGKNINTIDKLHDFLCQDAYFIIRDL